MNVEIRTAFPIDIGIFVPETIVSPIIAPMGCKVYLFSQSIVFSTGIEEMARDAPVSGHVMDPRDGPSRKYSFVEGFEE
jgi:hypothetical protein